MAITPTHDPTLEHLALYLKEGLNEAARLHGSVCVVGVNTYSSLIQATDQFPLLQVYRMRSRGSSLDECQVEIAYYLPSMVEQQTLPAMCRWVEKTICGLLADYEYTDTVCLEFDLDTLRSEYGIGMRQIGTATVPFPGLKIQVMFKDLEPG